MVLWKLTAGLLETESVGEDTVLMVDDLWVCVAVLRDIIPGTDIVRSMSRRSYVHGFIVLSPHDDVLPVVPVTVVGTLVLLEVVAVHMTTPAIVATRPGVDVVVLQVDRIATSGLRGRTVVDVVTRVEVAVGTDGRGVVAAVGVEVQS